MKELNTFHEYTCICHFSRLVHIIGWCWDLNSYEGAALGGMRLVRFHSILLPLGSFMSLTKTCTVCGIFTPGKRTITGK